MDITDRLEPGNYVVAVSGGVDSVALLHILQSANGYKLTVAHFDHGIRTDSTDDEQLVRRLAQSYGLPYVYQRAALGPSASEAAARAARYAFLRQVCRAADARAVITAHHQDDALETAVFNIIRGTGRRGVTSLRSTDIVKRPLLQVPKAHIIAYARAQRLIWREDSTNADTTYKRNYIRHNILKRFAAADRQSLHDIVTRMRHINHELDELLAEITENIVVDTKLRRSSFIALPHAVAREVMRYWLQTHQVTEIDKKLLERLVQAAKTYENGKRIAVKDTYKMVIDKNFLALEHTER